MQAGKEAQSWTTLSHLTLWQPRGYACAQLLQVSRVPEFKASRGGTSIYIQALGGYVISGLFAVQDLSYWFFFAV